MEMIKLFTHTDLDGIGCAIIAYLAFGRENVDVEYCNYNDVNEKIKEFLSRKDVSYIHTYITDISVNGEVAKEIDMLGEKNTVRLFDHHATALRLNQYSQWACVKVEDLDTGLKTSGTEMLYKYLECRRYFEKLNEGSRENIKQFVEAVRDYDTWRWKDLDLRGLSYKNMNDLFHIYGRNEFIGWAITNILSQSKSSDPYFLRWFSKKDVDMLFMKQREIDRYIEKKDRELSIITDKFGHLCGVVFADQYISELGNQICIRHPEIDYVAIIDISSGNISYRCVRDDIDLGGEIAHSYGGGGHRKAAGSQFDVTMIQLLIINQIFT